MFSRLKTQIRETALEMLSTADAGFRYAEWHRAVWNRMRDVSPSTIASELHSLRQSLPPGYGVVEGLYRKTDAKRRTSSERGLTAPSLLA